MPHTPHDFLDEARRAIPEVSVEAVAARRTQGDEVVLLDVREHEEVRTGYIEPRDPHPVRSRLPALRRASNHHGTPEL